jgi:hypothetical protein
MESTRAKTDKLNVEVMGTDLFWQGILIGPKACVTFTGLSSKIQSLLFKRKGSGIW